MSAKVASLAFRSSSSRSSSFFGQLVGLRYNLFTMSLTADGPQPTSGIERIPPQLDAEKNQHNVNYLDESDTNSRDIDGDKPQEFQRGVERVRIITSIWSKPTLISMFVL